MLHYDHIAYVIVSCSDCGAEWDEDMTELATGYTLSLGWDRPKECPECRNRRNKDGE